MPGEPAINVDEACSGLVSDVAYNHTTMKIVQAVNLVTIQGVPVTSLITAADVPALMNWVSEKLEIR